MGENDEFLASLWAFVDQVIDQRRALLRLYSTHFDRPHRGGGGVPVFRDFSGDWVAGDWGWAIGN